MKLNFTKISASVALTLLASQASAEGWYAKVGLANIALKNSGDVNVGGAVVPGAGFDASDENTLLFTIGRQLTPRYSLELTGGIPPTTTTTGTGTSAALGKTGELTYGAVSLQGNYHLQTRSKFKPYVGAGISYFVVLDTEDGSVTDLDAENAFAPVIQAGINYEINDKWGAYLNIAKVFAETEITGNVPAFGGAALSSDAEVDLTIVSVGMSMRF